jgi:hypothetical protein
MAVLSGAFAARIHDIQISNAASTDYTTATYVAIEKSEGGEFSASQDRAETSNNDDAGNKTYVTTWADGQLTFDLIADETATGQEHIWTAVASAQTRAFAFMPQGVNVGSKQIKMLGQILSITQPFAKTDPGRYRVTVGRTGGQARSNQ